MADLATAVQEVPEFAVPECTFVPVVDTGSGDIGFLSVKNLTLPAEYLDEFTEMTNEHLAPQLDRHNVEFMMHMFDNVVGNVTLPIVAHVAQLKEGMGMLQGRVTDIQKVCGAYVKDFAETPCIAQAEKLRIVCVHLQRIADSTRGREVSYSWMSSSSPSSPSRSCAGSPSYSSEGGRLKKKKKKCKK